MKRVAIIKAFMRPESFKEAIMGLIRADTEEILIAYDGPDELWEVHKRIAFQANQLADVEIFRFPYDYGLAACRNRLVDFVTEKHFLMIDDDIIVPGNIWDARDIMNTPYLAAATFPWLERDFVYQVDAFDIVFEDNYIMKKTVHWPKRLISINGFIFAFPFDFVPNQGFWSREFFNDFRWDEHYVIEAEHEDLALQVKPSRWQFAVCINVFLFHIHNRKDANYIAHRFSPEKFKRSWLYFFHKWNIKEYRDGGELIPHIHPPNIVRRESVKESYEKWINK